MQMHLLNIDPIPTANKIADGDFSGFGMLILVLLAVSTFFGYLLIKSLWKQEEVRKEIVELRKELAELNGDIRLNKKDVEIQGKDIDRIKEKLKL